MTNESDKTLNILSLPLIPLRDLVVYPHMVIPLFVGREKSINALEWASKNDQKILLTTQIKPHIDEPAYEDLYHIGTIGNILQLINLPDGTVKVLIESEARVRLSNLTTENNILFSEVDFVQEPILEDAQYKLLVRSLMSYFAQYVKQGQKVSTEIYDSLKKVSNVSRLADTVAAHLPIEIQEKQEVLENIDLTMRVEFLIKILKQEIDLLSLEKKLRNRVKEQMEKSQKEYYLNEQMKAIQKELGYSEESANEFILLKERILAAKMSKEAEAKSLSELNKLKTMPMMSSEATVVRGYIDWMVSLPWAKRSRISYDINKAEAILEQDHYGLEQVKERVLEYLAVQARIKKVKAQVLCFVGPPGVGKTSLGISIAKATNRKYVRMALGGVRDEAEIRGHRRTYIGSMPGKIIQKMVKSQVANPLFLLDEIDKMGIDLRGDPASALLEVLDPEQNNKFNDHYLEIDYNLSDVLFVCTANSMNLPPALMDRMEIIRLSGYTEHEKINIATRFLIPKQKKYTGIKKGEIDFTNNAVRDIVRYYTKEAGVRELERQIAKICRKIIRNNLKHNQSVEKPFCVTEQNLEQFLGIKKYNFGKKDTENLIGQVNGLAWTEVGGELLKIETVALAGKGKIIKTGSLGDVMQESVQAALTVVRARSEKIGIPTNFHEEYDLHVHVPEGATPKDGPSAGIAMCTAMVSALSGIPIHTNLAMTGEITLKGEVLPIGGLKEKILAAHRGGIQTIIIPQENKKDLKEIPEYIKAELDIIPCRWIEEVWKLALCQWPLKQDLIQKPLSEKKFHFNEKITTT